MGILFFYFGVWTKFNKLKTPDQWLCAGSAECITKGYICRTLVLIKIEMNVSGSSRKGRNSLSP